MDFGLILGILWVLFMIYGIIRVIVGSIRGDWGDRISFDLWLRHDKVSGYMSLIFGGVIVIAVIVALGKVAWNVVVKIVGYFSS